MIYLKQSTASQEVLLGPFVDSTDGNTAETGLTIANTDIKIHKAGATTLANKNSGGATHISNGNYYAVLDATDTDTLGSGCIVVQVSGALAVRVDFCVLAANVYDSLIGGGDLLDVNATQISGDSTAADNLENAFDDTAGPVSWTGIIDQGTAQAATSTTLQLRSAAAFADDVLIGCVLMVFGSTQGYWQCREITDYVGSTDTATVDAWQVTPSGTITYRVLPGVPAPATPPAVNVTQFGGSAGTFASGRPEVNASHIGGSAISQSAGVANVNVAQISGDSTAADNLEAAADGTGYNLGGGSVVAASVTGNVGGTVNGLTSTAQGNVRTAVGLASANLDTQLDALPTAAENATAVWGAGTRALTELDEDNTTIDIDATVRAAMGLSSANLDTQLGDLPTNSELATALAAADDAVLAAIAALENLSAAEVNAEIVDALSVDTYAEPGQGAPAATASIAAKIGYLYKAWRNKKEQTATDFALYDDAGTTVDQKASVSDDGTTTAVGEIVSGP